MWRESELKEIKVKIEEKWIGGKWSERELKESEVRVKWNVVLWDKGREK